MHAKNNLPNIVLFTVFVFMALFLFSDAFAQNQACYNCCVGYSTVAYQGNRPVGGQLKCEGWCWVTNAAGDLTIIPCVKGQSAPNAHGEVQEWCGCPDETGNIIPPDECHTVGVKGGTSPYRTECIGDCPDDQICKKYTLSSEKQKGGFKLDIETCICTDAK